MRDPHSSQLAPKDAKFLLAAIVESSNDAIISKNLDGVITSWNAGAERLFGYTTEEALGKHMSLLACPGRESEMPHIVDRVKRGERTEHYEAWRCTKDQREVIVSLTVSPIRNAAGQIIGASKIARDITAQKQAEEAMRQAEKLAMLGRMAATISHEIRNPLDMVTNLLFLIEGCLRDRESRDYLKSAQEELQRISRITMQTLDFSRQSTRPQTLHMEEALDSAVAFHNTRLLRNRVEVQRMYRPCEAVQASEGEVRQVLLNLVGNALDAMSLGGTLTLRTRQDKDWKTGRIGIRATIADTGEGMTPETRARLFDAFYTTKGAKGTGLGLWVSSEIVKRHGGNICVRSSKSSGKSGSVFSVFLPSERPALLSQKPARQPRNTMAVEFPVGDALPIASVAS
ncbi:MAG: multi-sensor signal transduction histidine kinase [Acidobacteriaceae bacterium]|jgi:PAS domain S-box-containing protein|nr:multi-sensor signal transduction histidine kinase [Acidobacteriaceae bacterium]